MNARKLCFDLFLSDRWLMKQMAVIFMESGIRVGDYCAVMEVREEEKIVVVQSEWILWDGPATPFEFVPMMQQTGTSITDSAFFVTRRETGVNRHEQLP
jgi:hypothetical protein